MTLTKNTHLNYRQLLYLHAIVLTISSCKLESKIQLPLRIDATKSLLKVQAVNKNMPK